MDSSSAVPPPRCRPRPGRRTGTRVLVWACCDVALGHRVAAGDEVDEHAEERHDDHEDRPQRLGPAAHVVAAEDVDDHPEQQDDPGDPQEQPQHRPEHAEYRVVVREHVHVSFSMSDRPRHRPRRSWRRSTRFLVRVAVPTTTEVVTAARATGRRRNMSSSPLCGSCSVVSRPRPARPRRLRSGRGGCASPRSARRRSCASPRRTGSPRRPPRSAARPTSPVRARSPAYSMSSSLMNPPTSPSRALNSATSSWSSNSTAVDVAVGVLGDEHEVEDPDRAALDQLAELRGDLAVELVAGEPDDDVLDRTDRHRGASTLRCRLPERRAPLTATVRRAWVSRPHHRGGDPVAGSDGSLVTSVGRRLHGRPGARGPDGRCDGGRRAAPTIGTHDAHAGHAVIDGELDVLERVAQRRVHLAGHRDLVDAPAHAGPTSITPRACRMPARASPVDG